jgi:hypothetical protein
MSVSIAALSAPGSAACSPNELNSVPTGDVAIEGAAHQRRSAAALQLAPAGRA